jgi:hypothetical protein
MKHLRRYLEDQILALLQRRCTHPLLMVDGDALNGLVPTATVTQCKRCGAIKVKIVNGSMTHFSPDWERPNPNIWRNGPC